MNMSKFGIPEKSIWYIFIYAGIIIIITVLGIIPVYRYNSNANENIKKINDQIKQQSDLKPQYSMLAAVLEKKQAQALPYTQRSKIPREQAGKFQQDFRAIADKTGMMVVSYAPDMANLAGDSSYLLHNVAVKGEFNKFRQMLIELENVPYLDRIDEINIQQRPDGMEYKLKILIELGK
jgi:hypothetical protein